MHNFSILVGVQPIKSPGKLVGSRLRNDRKNVLKFPLPYPGEIQKFTEPRF